MPAWPAGLIVYGDATGKSSDGHVGASYYDLVEAELAGFAGPVELRVPVDNPDQKDRIAATNALLGRLEQGRPSARIDRVKCPDLAKDLAEVVWDPGGRKILKVSDPRKPYYWRTHASDGWTYKIAREYPLIDDPRLQKKAPLSPPIRPRRLLASIRPPVR